MGQIKIPGGFIPVPSKRAEPSPLSADLPENAHEGERCYSFGGGMYYKNVYKGNRLIGRAIYSNGQGVEASGFVGYEKTPIGVPPKKICDDDFCSRTVGEKDAVLWFEEFNDALSADKAYCPRCRKFHT